MKSFIYATTLLVLLLMASIVYSAKSNYRDLVDNTIERSQMIQEQRVNNIVSTMNRVQTTLDNSPLKISQKIVMYENVLYSLAKEVKMYESGGVVLLGSKLEYLVDELPHFVYSGDLSKLNFKDIVSDPQRYGSLPGNNLRECYRQMSIGLERGSCINTWTADKEYLYWHRIPNLGIQANGKHYYFLLGFKNNEALKDVYKYNVNRVITIAVQAIFVIFSSFVAIWAMKQRYADRTRPV